MYSDLLLQFLFQILDNNMFETADITISYIQYYQYCQYEVKSILNAWVVEEHF